MARHVGTALLVVTVFAVVAGPWLVPNPPDEQFRDFLYAPPMRVRVTDDGGHWHLPFVFRLGLASRVPRTFEPDRSERLPLRWFVDGHLVSLEPALGQPLLLLGGDALGRDVLARLVIGGRTTLAVAGGAALGALVLGLVVGGVAGYVGGFTDEALMRVADLVLTLPMMYVVLALRAVLPLVLSPMSVFWLLVLLLAGIAWPVVARGVRAVVATECRRGYVLAATALGASHIRILGRHLLPATRGFLTVQATLLLPGFILAETTLSFVGLGFAPPAASWGVMLREAANIRVLAEFPWLLSPAVAIIGVALGVNLLAGVANHGGMFAALFYRDARSSLWRGERITRTSLRGTGQGRQL